MITFFSIFQYHPLQKLSGQSYIIIIKNLKLTKYYEQYESALKSTNYRSKKDKPIKDKYFCNAGWD